MAENNSSAEHELLKAIEGKAVLGPRSRNSVEDARDKFYLAWQRLRETFTKSDLKANLTLENINRALMAAVAVMVLVQSGVIVRGVARIRNIPRFEGPSGAILSGAIETVSSRLKGYAYYTDIFLGRNIFLGKQAMALVDEVPRVSGIEELARDLRLTGISWSEGTNERFAMIEDMRVNVTYYLQEQETLKGFTIETIDNNRVVLKRDGKEIELR